MVLMSKVFTKHLVGIPDKTQKVSFRNRTPFSPFNPSQSLQSHESVANDLIVALLRPNKMRDLFHIKIHD